MKYLIFLLILTIFIWFCIFLISYLIYRKCFYNSKKDKCRTSTEIPGKYASKYQETIYKCIEEANSFDFKEYEIKSFDGLKLYGRFFNMNKNSKTIVLEFHGYKGNMVRDLSGGLPFDKRCGLNIFMTDQRGNGKSEGQTITFGVKERKDVISWCKFLISEFGSDINIILYGASMGASTILMSSNEDLPKQVKAIVADCGYTSPKEIIQKVTKRMHINPKLAYPFILLAARIYAGFNLNEITCIDAVKHAKIPIFIIHGKEDSFVPFEMGERIAEANKDMIKFYPFENADHAMSFYEDMNKYGTIMKEALEIAESNNRF